MSLSKPRLFKFKPACANFPGEAIWAGIIYSSAADLHYWAIGFTAQEAFEKVSRGGRYVCAHRISPYTKLKEQGWA